jgi:N,N'-diacetyllegionaminate synthase
LEDAPYEFRRPGYGITPDQFERLLDFRFREDLPGGHMVRLFDLEASDDK